MEGEGFEDEGECWVQPLKDGGVWYFDVYLMEQNTKLAQEGRDVAMAGLLIYFE